jgi:hypothetical protein
MSLLTFCNSFSEEGSLSVEPLKRPFLDWTLLQSAMDMNEFIDILPIFGAVMLAAWIISLLWRKLR